MKPKVTKLIPPDAKRCQFEHRDGSFMSFGPRKLIRCDHKPVVIAKERKPREDGLIGSMSLCAEHWKLMLETLGDNHATVYPV